MASETVSDVALDPETPPLAPPAAPSPDAHAPNAAEFLAGQALGRIEHKVDQALEQNGRIEAQQTRILDQHQDMEDFVGRVANDLVELRSRVSKIESSPPAPAHLPPPPALPPMRAPLPSVNTEMRTEIARTNDSIQVMAMKQETLDKKQDDQTVLLNALATTVKPLSAFFTPKVIVGLFALGVLLSGMIAGWVQRFQAPAPAPVVLTAPVLPVAPAAPAPRTAQ